MTTQPQADLVTIAEIARKTGLSRAEIAEWKQANGVKPKGAVRHRLFDVRDFAGLLLWAPEK